MKKNFKLWEDVCIFINWIAVVVSLWEVCNIAAPSTFYRLNMHDLL